MRIGLNDRENLHNKNMDQELERKYPVYFDLHTHSISSGHGSRDTVSQLICEAAKRGLKYLGISDHGPATEGSAGLSYFRGQRLAPRQRSGINVLYGVELNIIDFNGKVDLPEEVLEGLDYAFISIHPPIFTPYEYGDVTEAYIKAMNHKKVKFLGHIDDARFPVDFKRLLMAAREKNIYAEINNSSLMPGAYRVGGQENCRKILHICKEIQWPVLLSSDSHGKRKIGNMEYIYSLLEECEFPQNLVLNSRKDLMKIIKG